MHRDTSVSSPRRRVLVAGLVLVLSVASLATGVAATPPTAGPTDDSTLAAALGVPHAPALGGFPPSPWVNRSDTSHDPTTTTSLSVAYNATGSVGSASDVTVELLNASDGTVVASNATLAATEGSATLTVPADTFAGDQSVTYRLKNGSSGASLATDTSLLATSGGGGGGSGFVPAPWVNQSDTSHDPTTTTSLSVAYNATGQVGSASDVTVELLNASDGTVVVSNATLDVTEGFAGLTVPADSFAGDQPVTYRLKNGSSDALLATDTSLLSASGGGSSTVTVDSVTLSKNTVAPGESFDVDVTLNNTGGASGSTRLTVFDVGTTDSASELVNRSVSVGAGTTKTVTGTVSVSEAGLSDLYVVAGTGFERTQVLVQPGTSLSVTGFSTGATTVEQNEDLELTATVTNTGNTADWMLVPVSHDGSVTQVKNVTVPANDQKQVTVATTFATTGSHTVAVGSQPPTGITVERRGTPAVVDSSVTVVGGTQPSGDVIAGTTVSSGKLDVFLKAEGVQSGEADLSNVGADTTTRLRVEVELKNFTPRMMLGTGGNVSWSVGPGTTAETTNLTVTVEPREAQRFYYQDGSEPTYSNWPNQQKQATTMRAAQATFSFYNMGNAPVRFRSTLTGGTIVTDAQSFSPPRYRQGSNTQKPRLTVQVAGPHLAVDGSQNQGYYEAVIPDGMLEQWGVTSAGQLRAAYGGSQTQATFSRTATGIEMKLDTHYSAETVEIRPDATDVIAPTADAGSDQTVTAGQSVTFDASATTDDVGISSYEWDVDDDGTYEVSTTDETVTHTYTAAGTVTATLRVTDGAGNTDTDAVTVTVESASGGGGSNGGGSSAGGSSGGDAGDDDDTAGPSVDVSTTDDAATVTVVDGSGAVPTDVDFGPTPPADGGVSLPALSVTAAGAFDLSVAVAAEESSLPDETTPLPPVPGADDAAPTLGYLSVAHPSLDETAVSGATFDLAVERARLADRDVEPEDVVVYRYHDGAWRGLDTRLVETSAGAHRYRVESPGLSVFAVAVRRPSFAVGDAGASARTVAPGESTTVTATVENVGTADGTHAVDLLVDGEVRTTRAVDLAPGDAATVSFTFAPDAPGTYALRVGDASAGRLTVAAAGDAATDTVVPSPAPTATDASTTVTGTATRTGSEGTAPGFGPLATLVALSLVALAAGRRR